MPDEIDPSRIRYSVPTLSDRVPGDEGDTPALPNCRRLHEDDWRQFEFVADFKEAIQAEFDAIDRIWIDHGERFDHGGTGFRRLHLRQAIPRPLDIPMTIDEFALMFTPSLDRFSLAGYHHALSGFHAVTYPGLMVYAELRDDRLVTLGLHPDGPFQLPERDLRALSVLMSSRRLRLVHWPSGSLCDRAAELEAFLRGQGWG